MQTSIRGLGHATNSTSLLGQGQRPAFLVHEHRSPASTRQCLVKAQSGRTSSSLAPSSRNSNREILEAFFYGRAFAITLSKRVSEALVEAVSDVGKVLSDRPKRIQEFQEEVAALARKEMLAASGSLPSESGESSGTSADRSSTVVDVQAMIDDLRASIAESRAVLQQIKAEKGTIKA